MLPIILSVLAAIAVAWTLAYHRASAGAWLAALAAGAACLTLFAAAPAGVLAAAWVVVALFGALAVVKPIRRAVVSGPLFGLFKRVLPQM
ncbi:MAG: acyl-CoA dehydrogenase, partial [Betaproteobacteria bacterium]|nr:acyl-CoA dehydrogenase [Betaproteobacteria bacterium]